MRVFQKLKDVLFDVEEELPTINKKDKKDSKKELKSIDDDHPIKEIKMDKQELPSVDDPFKTESPFDFPLDIDEDLDLARSKTSPNIKLREDYSSSNEPFTRNKMAGVSRSLLHDNKPTEKTTPFKSSPIISPVYGILDKNYSKDDVIVKTDIGVKGPDLDEVRKKAYGKPEKKISETVELKEEFDNSLKTLDEILMAEEKNEEILPKEIEPEIIDDKIFGENPLDKVEDIKEIPDIDDTVETDLFNLIDSMYEDKEEEREEE